MKNTLELAELKMQVAAYQLAINAIFSTLSPTQRKVAVASFKSLSERTHRVIDDGKNHQKTIVLYKNSCAKVVSEMDRQ